MANIYDTIPARRKEDSTNLMESNINKTIRQQGKIS